MKINHIANTKNNLRLSLKILSKDGIFHVDVYIYFNTIVLGYNHQHMIDNH